MKLYDCFPFFNELDLLDVRLHEMYDLVHRFVLVESPLTHQGNPKPLHFLENRERFKHFADKIIHVVEDFGDTANDPWARENAQRNRISQVIENLEDESLVIVSDLDEIPFAARLPFVINPMKQKPSLKYLHMRFFYYFLNCEFREVVWDRGFIAPACLLKSQNLSHVRLSYSRLPKIMPVRGNLEIVERSVLVGEEEREDYLEHIRGNTTGWHFSYAGGVDKVLEKLRSFAHAEFNNNKVCTADHVRSCMDRQGGVVGGPAVGTIVPVDETFPRYVLDNIEVFKQKGFLKTW